jgi:hypothetical protein
MISTLLNTSSFGHNSRTLSTLRSTDTTKVEEVNGTLRMMLELELELLLKSLLRDSALSQPVTQALKTWNKPNNVYSRAAK